MEKEFKVLSLKEEQKLSIEELKKYYQELREYVLKRKLTNTTPGATTIAPKLKGITTKIADLVTRKFTNDNIEWICDGNENVPDGTVIYAHTHQGILDNFVWIPEVDRHCLLLHSRDTSLLLLMCQLNTGLIFVKKGDKTNNHNAKLDMIKLLLDGHSITYFPESAWNLSPNKLHLPMSYGIIDIAKKAHVPIVPVAHEYTYDTSSSKETIIKIHSRYGEPIYVSENDDLLEKLNELNEQFSTMKYELMELNGIFERSSVSNLDYTNFLKGCYKNLEFGKISVDNERKHLFGADDYFYKLYHINDVPFTDDGILLDSEETNRINEYSTKAKVEYIKKNVYTKLYSLKKQ